MALAICPGSFDPFTSGHLDIVKRSAEIFDEVVVLILKHPEKNPCFTVEERFDFIKRSVQHLPNVWVDSHDGLLVEYAADRGSKVLIKGLRAMSDYEYEFQMALVNKKLMPDTETFFMTTSAEFMFLSSSIVRQLVELGREITDFVPKQIEDDIIRIMRDKR